MSFNFSQDWPVFILIGVFIWFVVALIINSRKNQRRDQKKDK